MIKILSTDSDSVEARSAVEAIIYGALRSRGGVISAEHGIGLEKKSHLGINRNPDEITLMQTLKKALDPKGILNPGKLIDSLSCANYYSKSKINNLANLVISSYARRIPSHDSTD